MSNEERTGRDIMRLVIFFVVFMAVVIVVAIIRRNEIVMERYFHTMQIP